MPPMAPPPLPVASPIDEDMVVEDLLKLGISSPTGDIEIPGSRDSDGLQDDELEDFAFTVPDDDDD